MPVPQGIPAVRPVPAILPVSKYPHLAQLVHELDFICSSCSSVHGQTVYRTFMEAEREPIAGPGDVKTNKKGMVATRFLLRCPDCKCVAAGGAYIDGGVIDLLAVSPKYKRPERAAMTNENSLAMDVDPAAPVLVTPDPPVATQPQTQEAFPKPLTQEEIESTLLDIPDEKPKKETKPFESGKYKKKKSDLKTKKVKKAKPKKSGKA